MFSRLPYYIIVMIIENKLIYVLMNSKFININVEKISIPSNDKSVTCQ